MAKGLYSLPLKIREYKFDTMKKFGLIFDLDGTLIDSREDLALSVNSLLKELGYDPLPIERISSYIGNGANKLAEHSLKAVGAIESMADSEFPKLYDRLLEYYGQNLANKTTVYPGVYQVLEKLSDHPMALVTNKPTQYTRPVLEAFNLDEFFTFIAGGDSYQQKKPDPYPLKMAMESMHILPEKCAMIGDGDTDIKAGQAAGVYTVAAAYGYRSHTVLKKLDPDYTIESFRDLIRVVHEIESA